MTSWMNAAPFAPTGRVKAYGDLPDRVSILNRESAKLAGHLNHETAQTIRRHMAVINSYYSNLIEGNQTLPHQIREAQRGNYDSDPTARDHQLESVAHIKVQDWIRSASRDLDEVLSPEFIRSIHRHFYADLPERLKVVKDEDGNEQRVVGGEFRTSTVSIGRHIPPDHQYLKTLVDQFCSEYKSQRYVGEMRITALMAAHHRLLWIHPFLDGNGRVVRLWTDAALQAAGVEGIGVWCLSRGLARSSSNYKAKLAHADYPLQGTADGRGPLSDTGLTDFTRFMVDTAIDQVDYVGSLLDLKGMQQRIENYVNARRDGRIVACPDPLKPEASLILFQAFIQGSVERAHALRLAGGRDGKDRTARRALHQLKADGLLSERNNRSPLKWEIPEHAEPFYFPNLSS